MNQVRFPLSGVFVILGLVACGGGGSGSSNSSGGSTASTYTPSATVLAAKTTNFATPFYASTGSGSGCGNVSNTTVYVQPNTITYAAQGVSELSQQQAAEYAEQAVGEIRTVLGVSSATGYQALGFKFVPNLG